MMWVRTSRGILGKGTESFASNPKVCGAKTAPGEELCARHLAVAARLTEKLARKREMNAWKERNA